MKFIWFRIALLVAAILAPLLLSQINSPAAKPAARKAVVVELFTSEGCSSCPPADELLARLRQEPRTDGVEVIPLGLHVDYWNFQGWTDRFSSNAYSQRQFKYAERFRLQSPYTPQLVFDGAAESDGDDLARAHHLIEEAAQHAALAEVQISPAAEDKLAVSVKASGNLRGEIFLAVTEDNLASKVVSGENNGHELRHAAVVRDLRSLGSLHADSFAATVPLKIKKDWKRSDLRAVVFVQEPGGGAIDGAASLTLNGQSTAAR
ncbi:MAG TPA: DUF1223 domain-containing protein [Candidatus Angelobacter sp.]|nr:DUF1223 domain-containing protein [Candidatus Angelobacter sp.]